MNKENIDFGKQKDEVENEISLNNKNNTGVKFNIDECYRLIESFSDAHIFVLPKYWRLLK